METASVIRKFRPTAKPLAGRKGSTAKPVTKRTAGTHRNGFLNHAFQPFWGVAFRDWKSAEQEFFVSAENLCALYQWTMPDVSGLSFPENIREAYKMITAQETTGFSLEVKICQDEKRACCMTTGKTFNTDYHLYYIPVRAVWKMRDKKAEQSLYKLVISVFGYFYQVAGIPFFTEPGTIDSTYDTIKNWLDEEADDDEETDRNNQRVELELLKKAGDTLLPEIKRPFDLKQLESCLKIYRKGKQADTNMIEAVAEIIKLIKDYPKRAIRETMYYDKELDDGETIYWEQYISFYWSGEDCLNDTVYNMINDEFQQMGYQEEPLSLQWFDRPQEKEEHVFDYEPRLFSVINRLSELLNDYDYEELNK
ncbi:hypothetical protein [Mucilaginibacter ginsenosidivorans]|uniref:PRTRC system protein F n=1 Tax=Mucilaginibacter ginsenosidivorans TaxID=398053 RepID=A0A5B8UTQ7_9SPHI|nr:hypothetical protein [Mucilaginibacter ginsenosidivorans]QEC62394.1 hypothetical protein FRZ54_07280 [Mucilaginibacter ginsenosidivorans]